MKKELLPVENLIYEIRQQRVMLDSDLAKLYGVETGRLNEAVKRNISRFPENFMFQLTPDEYETLISQIAISKKVCIYRTRCCNVIFCFTFGASNSSEYKNNEYFCCS